ncbi:hypothetical protein LOC68_02345 [Blastopirellula sp. JC732]|uniref:Carboxypeptidase regulatory-like domain-containing protein n=1 Tax=Blastopirellula sediminis TaxID=2894196 RepID=A0A9X1SEI8_9BACT|nr:hypothetical protein [Blastopirellula sediminis]MCC9607969.1 hypothetical protein [Blastopirellula sediminis]MCC9627238.1 hypothetical protein [Blastopirellula sediminis]
MKRYLPIYLGALFAMSGCNMYSSQIETISVQGIVQLEGKPVENVEVAFQSDELPMAFGITDAEGKYELSTRRYGKGASPGNYTAKIFMTDKTSFGGSGKKVTIPKIYSEKGVAAVTVDAKEGRQFDFNLVSKPSRKASDWLAQESEQ